MYGFEQRTAVITGAAQGIGYAIAEKMSEYEIKHIAILDLNLTQAEEAARRLDPTGDRVKAFQCDVCREESVQQAFSHVREQFGTVDILVNNAGFARDAMFTKMTDEQFAQVVQVHLFGTFYCTKQVVDGMREQQWGRIINMSSMASYGNVGQANYSAAKAGIRGLSSTLALELANKNITVNCIAPGMVNTDFLKSVPEKVLDGFIQKIPMHRLGDPKEVAALAAFLASEDAAYITGRCIDIAGGL